MLSLSLCPLEPVPTFPTPTASLPCLYSHHPHGRPGERRPEAPSAPSPPPSPGVRGCLFCHMLFCDRIRAVNMTRPAEPALGAGSASQGCGPASNDPGARARPDPGSTAPHTTALPTPHPGAGARGRAAAVPAVPGHFLLPVPHEGGAGPWLCVLSKTGKTSCLWRGKSPPHSSTALGHQSVLTKQRPNGLSINESGTYGSHLP